MKKTKLIFTLILIGLLPAGAVKKFNANPINVAVVIVEKEDSAKIASYFDYSGYIHQGEEDGYQIMRRSDGNEMRYSFNNGNPTIIVKPQGTAKNTNTILNELKFVKSDGGFERMVNRYNQCITKCNQGLNGTLEFKRIKK